MHHLDPDRGFLVNDSNSPENGKKHMSGVVIRAILGFVIGTCVLYDMMVDVPTRQTSTNIVIGSEQVTISIEFAD